MTYIVYYIFDKSLDKSLFSEVNPVVKRWKLRACFAELVYLYRPDTKFYLLLPDSANALPKAVDFIRKECNYVICSLVDLIDTPYYKKDYSLLEIDTKLTEMPARLLSFYLLGVYFREFSEGFRKDYIDLENLSWEDFIKIDYRMSNWNHSFFDAPYSSPRHKEYFPSRVFKSFFNKETFSSFLKKKVTATNGSYSTKKVYYSITPNGKLLYCGQYHTQIGTDDNVQYEGTISNTSLFLAMIEFLYPELLQREEPKLSLELIAKEVNRLENE